MNFQSDRNRRPWLALSVGAPGLAVFILAGCTGIPTSAERTARQQQQAVAWDYRPDGNRPLLPALTADASLSNYLMYAMLNSPKVESAYYDWVASIERITQARAFPDPQFSFQMDIQNAVTSVMPGLMGAIPWPDKLHVGAQVASAESRAKYFVFQSAILESAFAVKRAYYQLYFLIERLRVNRESLKLLGDLEELARSQNEAGKVTLQDVLRAQIEQDRLRTEIANLEDSRLSLMTQLKGALGLRAENADPPVPKQFESTPLDLTPDKILASALAQNNRLKELEFEVRAAEASLMLARKARLPDFSLGFMADVKMNPTLYRFPGNPGTVSLPIWRDKNAARIAEAQANKRSAEARHSAEQIALTLDFAEKSYLYREATRNLELLDKQLLPKARLSLEVARSGYLASQIDFFNLTDSQRTVLAFELDKIEAATQRELVLTELSLVVQGMSPQGGTMGSRGARSQSPVKKSNTTGM